MERLQHIREKLNHMGENYENLKPFLLEYLDRIEMLVEEQENLQIVSINVLKDSVLTPVAVAHKLGCSRTTLYNHNQILKRYIEYSAEDLLQRNPLGTLEEAVRKQQALERQVSLMETRDINNERLKHDCATLTNLLKNQNVELQRLRNRVMELTSEIQQRKPKE